MYPFPGLFILFVIPSICKGQHETTCNVVPKDQYIEVGSDTEIVCQTSCVHGKIFWTLNNRRIDESLSNTINSSHTVLTLRNFTHHSATLQCHSAATKQVLGGTTIKTYSKPSNISCIFHYDNLKMNGIPPLFTCNWDHQIDSSLDINYTVLYASVGDSQTQSEICNSKVTTCTVKNTSPAILFGDNATVTVRAKTAAWEVNSKPEYEFNTNHILKMSPPVLTVTTFSDHLWVQCNRFLSSENCHCQVKYSKAVKESTPEWVLNKTLESYQKGFNVTIEKVESCTNYKFAARCALVQAPWSEWSHEKTVLTKLNKRHVKLRLWRQVAEPEKNGVRKVHAMWTEIPSACQGTFTYTIKQTPYKEHVTGVNYTDSLCGNSTCDVDVNQDAHRINLTVFDNEALLVEDSVYVPAIGESLPQVTDIQTSTLKGRILVSWKAPVQPVSGYMIDYTHNGNQYQWKESKYTNATLVDLLDMKPYNITVTPLFDDKTGHGTQALQICSRVGDPGNVTIIDVQAIDQSARVTWTVKSQEACSGVVVNYTVFYGTQKGPQLNVSVDSTKQDILLKDLNPDTQYSVYVNATALTGTTKSSERFFETKTFDPRLMTALIVCGCITIFLVLSVGLCCAIQWKKFKEKPVPNPGLSTLALWPSTSHQKRTQPFQPFSNPSESLCDMVYTEEAQRTPTPPLATGCNGNPASEQTEEYIDPAIVPAPDSQNEDPAELVETHHPSSPGESTALLSSTNTPLSPYRSQSSVESPAPRTSKQCKRVPVKQQEKTPPVTVYVTLDMFEQGQGR
ncbi:interleukin-31 receptor subunit alpha-like isoform X2 [Siniperca chuatsi]|uniref:interleukin-31 receptor subunit alpha-like isoform X2 n=1 Tax=Siniperca chuatsi TaxID=119488 RepID=UPI001CE22258|nr:interleukin-31 receptor subunit alpha-like isoform X2 [Siniperca chuatsi]